MPTPLGGRPPASPGLRCSRRGAHSRCFNLSTKVGNRGRRCPRLLLLRSPRRYVGRTQRGDGLVPRPPPWHSIMRHRLRQPMAAVASAAASASAGASVAAPSAAAAPTARAAAGVSSVGRATAARAASATSRGWRPTQGRGPALQPWKRRATAGFHGHVDFVVLWQGHPR